MKLIRKLCQLGWLGLMLAALHAQANEAVWQWSVPLGEGRAFLWIPEDCVRVRAVIVAQHNMIEEGILEHAVMRRELGRLGIAEIWIAPPSERTFDFTQGAGERFDMLMIALAAESGYGELAWAPVIPIGHSACASYPWNFAAWNPQRTLAVLSIKGDAPQTNLTGSGRPNPDWAGRNIDGVPGLMVMSEAEWWEARLTPLLEFRAAHPTTPLAVLADTGHGHFDASDELVGFLALFIRQAATARLPATIPLDRPGALRPVDPAAGWLVDRWRGAEPPRAPAAPAADYAGDRTEAFWCFDVETARAIEACQTAGRGKKPQQLGYVQAGQFAAISTAHAGVELKFMPREDGVTFQLTAEFITPLPPKPPVAAKDKPPAAIVITPTVAPAGTHALGEVRIARITGPVRQVTPDTFQVSFNRTASTTDSRRHDIWLIASQSGDEVYKGAVQQALLKIAPTGDGAAQAISFPAIPDRPVGGAAIALQATSDAGLPVSYYVREGPAYVEGSTLHLTALPPRSKLPVWVTVVAWQFGRGSGARVNTATPVERSFQLTAAGK
jgi:hypothetical protein